MKSQNEVALKKSKRPRSGSLVIWLNTRKGFYNRQIFDQLARGSDQEAFNRYVNECERAYKANFKKLVKQDLEEIESLNAEMKEFLKQHLWAALLSACKGDKRAAAKMLGEPEYLYIVKEYELQEVIRAQYKKS